MSEKTERPSARKLKKAREEGNVPQSSELASALIFLGALSLLWAFGPKLGKGLKALFVTLFSTLNDPQIENLGPPILSPLLFILGGVFVIAILAHLLQTGWIWSWPKSSKGKGESRWVILPLKVAVIAFIGYFELNISQNAQMLLESAAGKVDFLLKTLFFLLVKIGIALLVLGILDYFYQKWKYDKQMHMTKQELKEEQRETEGDRKTKIQMRQR